ncbi:MAG: hypothetical protein ACLQGU_06495 [bacterium]
MTILKTLAVATAIIGLTICSYALLEVSEVYAGEIPTPALSLERTYIKTTNTALYISPTPVDAFTPTIVRCPGSGTCTIRVEVSTQFSGITPPEVAAVVILIDDSQTGVQPYAVLGFDSTSTGGASNVRTFSVMKERLSRGHHSVDVLFYVTGGSAASASRTLTIEIYKPFKEED